MSIVDNTIKRNCTQTAVYWGSPVNDGKGGFTFDDPIEIDCRWEEKKEVYTDREGKESISMAVVFLLQDVDEEGYLYLGESSDFDSADDTDDPKSLSNVFEIRRFDKIPEMKSTTKFLRKVYL